MPQITAPSTSMIRYTKAVLFPLVSAPRALKTTGREAPMPIPIIIGNATSNWMAPVAARACRIPIAALALCSTAVTTRPTSMPSMGFEKLVRNLRKFSSDLSGDIAPDIMLMPYISTAKPSIIPPRFFSAVFFANIHIIIPARATIPVSTAVLRSEATLEPLPPRLLRQRTQPVTLVPSMAPSMIPMAWRTFIMPEFTKPTTITDVAEDDWITAVTTVPRSIALGVFPESL